MGFTFRYMLWLMILGLLVLCFFQYGTYLTSVKERRPVQILRFPDMHIWFSDLSFDFDSRSITYDFQFQIWTGTSQREIYFSFSSYMAPGFSFTGTIDSPSLPSKYYQVNRKSTAERCYVSLKITLAISRILGYSSLISLAIVWAGNVILASSLFLTDN